jgi:ubiquinone/menaquinone biosynthesis C-methylase UbiE
MKEIEYHLGELEIARTPGDPRRVMPVLPDSFGSILDLGCGVGQTLISCGLKPETFACGVDINAEALAYGKELSPDICFVCARGERLPFSDRSFDVVISRVTLPLLHIPSALQEIERVLKPGGHVWFTLHPFSMQREKIIGAIRSMDLKSFVYQTYILINGICFHLTGRQFRFPFKQKRCESFQTIGGVTRAMRRAGFEQVRVEHGHFFVVTAVKKQRSPFTATKEEKVCAASAG